jgi:dTDP-4-dehydrorhamnose 3,5-epimerase-like enzyme
MMDVEACALVSLPRFTDPRGNLSFIEANVHVPFRIERIYYLYGVPAGASRGAHAHKTLHQLMIPIAGSFDVVLNDGTRKRRVKLTRPEEALYICPMIWRDLQNFSADAVCLVLASAKYDEADYFRSYDEFIEARKRA